MNFTAMPWKVPSTGLTQETYRDKLLEVFQRSVLSEDELASQISQTTDGGYSITEEDQRQRGERAALSQRARDIVVDTMVGMKFDPNAKGLTESWQRSFTTLLDYSGAPGATEKNANIRRIFTEGTPEEQKEYILRTLRESPYIPMTMEQANSMSDQEVVDGFSKMLPIFFLNLEIENMLSNSELPFTPEDKEFLQGLQDMQHPFGLLQARMNMIANPYYDIFHYERFSKVNARDAEAAYSRAVPGYPETDAYGHYVQNLILLQFEKRELIKERFAHHMEELGLDMDTLTMRNAQGEIVHKDDFAETLQLGGTLLLQPPSGAAYAFQIDPQNEQPKPVSPAESRKSLARKVRADMGEPLAAMVEQADNASRRVLWGSSQFKTMQTALTKLSEFSETLGEQPTPQQLTALRKQLHALESASKAYLEYKREEKHLGEEEELVGKNGREQGRIDAARAIQDFAREKLSLLTLSDKLVKANPTQIREMSQESVWRGEANQNAAGQQMGNEAKRIRDAFGPADYQPGESVHSRYSFVEIRDASAPGALDCMGKVWVEAQNAQVASNNLESLANKPSLTSEDMEHARANLAHITTIELILQERNGETHPKEAGPLEKKLVENPARFVKSVEKDPLFQKATADLNPKKLAYFLQERGGRHIAGAMLDKAKELQQQTQANIQKAKELQQKTKANLQKPTRNTVQNVALEDAPVTRPRSKTQPSGSKPKLPNL